MKVTKHQIDDLNLTVDFALDRSDWEEPRKKKLNEFRRTADLKGFRRGMAPMSLIEKLHGGQALAESINTLVSDGLDEFIKKNKLAILGEPLPSEKEDKNDWDNPDKFKFSFDIAIAPKVEIALGKDDKIPYYEVKMDDKAVEDYKNSLLRQYGQLETGTKAGEDDFIIVDFEASETKVEGAYVALRSITDAKIKKSFVGLEAGAEKEVDIEATFTNETDRAAMFKVKKEELETLPVSWKMTVKEVKTFVNAPLEQATFDTIFGEGSCKDEAQFTEKVKERLAAEYRQESEYRFMVDAKEYLIEKAAVALPDEFMKRWIIAANDGKFTKEDVEKEYDLFAKDFRWNIIRTQIMKDQNLKITKDDITKQAKEFAAYQFAMYGMNNVPEEHLAKYAEQILGDRQQADRIVDRVEDNLVLNFLRDAVTLENKKVTLDKMRELTK